MKTQKKAPIFLTNTSKYNIYYEDTDFSGFVYHANYLKLFERSRSNMIGISALKDLFDEGFHFVVSKARLEFKAPARFGDEVEIHSSAIFSKSPRVIVNHILKNAGGAILVIGEIEIACLGKNNRPTQIPELFLSYLKNKHIS